MNRPSAVSRTTPRSVRLRSDYNFLSRPSHFFRLGLRASPLERLYLRKNERRATFSARWSSGLWDLLPMYLVDIDGTPS
jgi:hypothetical protein